MALQTLHEPVVIARVYLWYVVSLMGLSSTGIGYKLYYIPLQKWSPQQHYCSTVDTPVHTQTTPHPWSSSLNRGTYITPLGIGSAYVD